MDDDNGASVGDGIDGVVECGGAGEREGTEGHEAIHPTEDIGVSIAIGHCRYAAEESFEVGVGAYAVDRVVSPDGEAIESGP